MNIFIVKRLDGKEDSLLLRLLLGKEDVIGGLFQKISSESYKGIVNFTDSIETSDYLLMPHNYFSVEKNIDYLKEIESFSKSNSKKIIVFAYGDRENEIEIEYSIVLRTSQYKNKIRDNEIIIPPFVENLGEIYGFEERNKSTEKPLVGFAGWSGFNNKIRYIKYLVKLFLSQGVNKQGIYFRKKVTGILEKSNKIDTNFKLRSSYSGHKNDIEDDPKKIREEYIDIIKNSDLALAVKGDGNYSLRFFEILSLGRIPLLIDTDSPLPLENEINYDDFILRVNYKDVYNLENIISDFWSNISDEKYIGMQNKALDAFNNNLEPSAFYRYLFSNFDDIVQCN